jgi:RNA polymerase sigma-70 factor (ECF subfamily)
MEHSMEESTVEQFVGLFSAGEHEIFRYIYALIPKRDDAQDVMQATALALWRKFAEYDRGQPFVPWACRFAYYEVLRFRKAHRHWAVRLSQETISVLADDSAGQRDELEPRREALLRCIEKLPALSRQLLEQRYTSGLSVQEIAKRTNRSVHTLYKSMQKIRNWLLRCIAKTLDAEVSA